MEREKIHLLGTDQKYTYVDLLTHKHSRKDTIVDEEKRKRNFFIAIERGCLCHSACSLQLSLSLLTLALRKRMKEEGGKEAFSQIGDRKKKKSSYHVNRPLLKTLVIVKIIHKIPMVGA